MTKSIVRIIALVLLIVSATCGTMALLYTSDSPEAPGLAAASVFCITLVIVVVGAMARELGSQEQRVAIYSDIEIMRDSWLADGRNRGYAEARALQQQKLRDAARKGVETKRRKRDA